MLLIKTMTVRKGDSDDKHSLCETKEVHHLRFISYTNRLSATLWNRTVSDGEPSKTEDASTASIKTSPSPEALAIPTGPPH
jgi:hypothetical protein